MLFIALCTDKPDHVELRLSTRAAHLAFLEEHKGAVKLGGPFLDDGDRPVGSMLVLDCETEAAARALLARDPYAEAGLFAAVEVKLWKRVVGVQL